MAEFKLGRIRFVWKGAWASGTVYYKDDIVRHGGRTYYCAVGHTASTLFTTDEATKWNLFTDGSAFLGDWVAGTYYKQNDIVKYGGYIYIANTAHTAEVDGGTPGKLETDQAKWDLFAEGFDWKNIWTVATIYKVNDLVKYGGTVYLCNTAHTSSSTFAADADGLEADQSKWDVFAKGIDWKQDWAPATKYRVNDTVKYGGQLYICNEAHLSSANITLGLEADQSKWDYAHKGIEYKSVHQTNTRYKVNDVVKYGGGLWIATREHTSGGTNLASDNAVSGVIATVGSISAADASRTAGTYKDVNGSSGGSGTGQRFNIIVDGTGAASITIVKGGSGHSVTDVITVTDGDLGGGGGASLTFQVATITQTTNWSQFVPGLEFEDSWSSATNYQPGDFVTYGGYGYVSKTNHSNVIPYNNAATWDLFTTGFSLKGDYASATAKVNGAISSTTALVVDTNVGTIVQGMVVTGTGISGTVTVATVTDQNNLVLSSAQTLSNNVDLAFNTAYKTGDVVRVGGYTYLNIADSTGNRPPNASYWEKLNEGINWRDSWANGTYYDVGDAVRGINNVNSYICVTAHTADQTGAQNRPDQDVDGSEWKLLSGGAESGNLTTAGDLVYYGGSGPTRLPIGIAGQVLKVNDEGNAPEWAYFGQVDQVYYVGKGGADEDAPGYGVTIDKPWKTIRHAMREIRFGPRNPLTKDLIMRNKMFIMREAGKSYVDYQVANAGGSGIWNGFTYDAAKYQELVGLLVDAIAYDISHGGNERSRERAQSYFSTGSFAPASQASQVSAVNSYVNTMLQRIVQNLVVTTNYQSLNSESNTVTQYNPAGVVPEMIGTQVSTLITLINEVIDAGDLTGLDAKVKPNTTVFVKTGTYTEVCPIVIPADTALVGDELRSTDIGVYPTGITLTSDATLSMAALTRISAVMSDLIQNNSITKTPAGAHVKMDSFGAADASRTAGTYNAVTGSSAGSGTVGTFNITVGAGGAVTGVVVVTGGTGHAVNDTITIQDSALGGGGAANFTMDVQEIATGNTQTQDTVREPGDATSVTNTTNLITEIKAYIDYGVNGVGSAYPEKTGQTTTNSRAGDVYARGRILANLDFLIYEGQEYIKANNTKLYMEKEALYGSKHGAKCRDDLKRYLEGIMWDLENFGNYMSLTSARYLVNSIMGSSTSDMFYMQNGTGLRNCTVRGLSGTLGSANAYGTKRPTAGAFVSLDPSWGPADTRAWISTRSPYVQNVTTFGTKCIGMKVDGDIHAGGNDSIVANDFTQILDQGIGAWVTNLGRAELVSVFSYYGHMGYLAENGGKIRATNGNSSYGDFGTVAEGVDLTETPIKAYVDNRSFEAVVTATITDNNNIIALEYANAGRDYNVSTTTITLSGDGYGVTGLTPVISTGGVMEIRLTGNANTFGGADYKFATNTPQAGTSTQITLSNTDTALSAAYVGMAVFLTGGKGAGQYGYVNTYNAGTKVATIKKYSDGSDGWDQIVSGRAIEAALDNTTVYSVEPRVVISAPGNDGSTATAQALARAKVADGKISEVRIIHPGASYTTPPTVTFTDPNNTADAPLEVFIGDGVLNQPSFTSRGTGYTTLTATIDDTGSEQNITGVSFSENPYANTLLTANKEYVKDEVIAWINNQISTVGGTLWGGFIYDADLWETQTGTLIDALANDVKFGGTKDTTAAARAYWIGTQTQLPNAQQQRIASFVQMKTILLDYILDNTSYSSLQSVTTQTTNSNNGEAAGQTKVGELIDIVTETIANGLASMPTNGGAGCVNLTVATHNILERTKITISEIVGTTQLNANSYFVKVIDGNTLQLYLDNDLLFPAVYKNGTAYVSGGKIKYGAGFRDAKQSGKYVKVEAMESIPQAGANVVFSHLPNTVFKLVSVTGLTGSNPYSALLQLSPDMAINDAPAHGTSVEMRIRYSQVRLTGHDFLDVGTGGFTTTNYPGTPTTPADPNDETVTGGGGRVFFTSTDQDGNFRVGGLFNVEQATGVATLNADAFSITGLQELQLGSVALGGTGATVNEFSTDGTFAANSDSIVPTQKAIKTYITSQIGGGASELNVNTVTAGVVHISGNTITTTTNVPINITATMNFTGGISGSPVAMQQFLLS